MSDASGGVRRFQGRGVCGEKVEGDRRCGRRARGGRRWGGVRCDPAGHSERTQPGDHQRRRRPARRAAGQAQQRAQEGARGSAPGRRDSGSADAGPGRRAETADRVGELPAARHGRRVRVRTRRRPRRVRIGTAGSAASGSGPAARRLHDGGHLPRPDARPASHRSDGRQDARRHRDGPGQDGRRSRHARSWRRSRSSSMRR